MCVDNNNFMRRAVRTYCTLYKYCTILEQYCTVPAALNDELFGSLDNQPHNIYLAPRNHGPS
jgi:hypothetical protein